MPHKLLTRLFCVAASMILLLTWSDAYSVTIITTAGERIQCEIVEDHGQYYIIDHEGYRRYLLKENVRAIERDIASLRDDNPLYRHSFAVMGNSYHNLEKQDLSFTGARIMYTYPIHSNIALELSLHAADGTVGDQFGSKLLPGSATVRGASVSALWNTKVWRTYCYFESGFGVFDFAGEAKEGERIMRIASTRGTESIPPYPAEVSYRQNPDPGYGIIIGVGALYPLTRHLSIEARVSAYIVDSQMRDEYTFEPVADNQAWADGEHVNTSELFAQLGQFNLGLRWAF